MAELKVRFCETYKGEPLAEVDFPGRFAEMTPAQMRSMADALRMAAEDCESGHTLRSCGLSRKDSSYDY